MKTFKKGEILTAVRLNELITSATLPAERGLSLPPRPGIQAQPGLARYNMQADDACSGEVSTLPDCAGLIKAAEYAAQDEPSINRGRIMLPLAHDYSSEDSSLPDESATGGIASINVVDSLQRPQINRGDIQLPLAQSSWPQTADGAMYTPGLVYGVQYDPVDDACEGSVLPRIDQGIIHLPAPTGSGDDEDTCSSSCSCPLASRNTPGLIAGVDLETSWIPDIDEGIIFIPPAQWSGTGSYLKGTMGVVRSIIPGGETYGTIDDGVIRTPWALRHVMPDPDFRTSEDGIHLLNLEGCDWCPVTMSKCNLPDGTTLYLNAWVENGALCLNLSTNSYYSY